MKRLVTYPLEGGGTVSVEVDDEPTVARRGLNPTDVTEKASSTFEGALSTVKPAVLAIASTFRGLADAPEEVEVEFGIKFSGQAGAIIASAETEAHFQMRMVWKRTKAE
jgi:hypothetical protein